jgi:hypothetical protein
MMRPAGMKRGIRLAALAIVLLSAVVYGADYSILRYRIAERGQAFGTVTVFRYYAVAEKNRKTEYVFDGALPQTCVHAIFAHLGHSPCWYLSRHTEQRIEI